ncbi:MAG: hypothetical protein EXS11_02480 [Gemmataceae bacterium]|nr:hypothetical protein [Gemmataceae bacterium]
MLGLPNLPHPRRVHQENRSGHSDQLAIAKPEAKLYPMTDFQVFRAELTCLEPGTEYAFKIGKSSGVYRFRTMPQKATDTITFVTGGDVGIQSAPVANNVMAARQNPHFAFVGGDLGYDVADTSGSLDTPQTAIIYIHNSRESGGFHPPLACFRLILGSFLGVCFFPNGRPPK